MPALVIKAEALEPFGQRWNEKDDSIKPKKAAGSLSRSPPYSSTQLTSVFDNAVGKALAEMLGGIPIMRPNSKSLTPPEKNCVEVGPVRVIGGVRPQNFDVGYRPDGLRFAFDSKTLNDKKSVNKNWQNMINDIATEATTVHTRFPHAVVAFLVALPKPCVSSGQRKAITETLERLCRREGVNDPDHMAEAITLVFWNPDDGTIDREYPTPDSSLRVERFPEAVYRPYSSRYKGLPPHVEADTEQEPGEENLPK